jgi:hypothetical protein
MPSDTMGGLTKESPMRRWLIIESLAVLAFVGVAVAFTWDFIATYH